MMLEIRRTEPDDYEAIARLFRGTQTVAGTLQLPYPSVATWRKRLESPSEGLYSLVATLEGEIIATLALNMNPQNPRRAHVASLGMVVRDDQQGKGVGTAIMRAAVDVADNWLNLLRLELTVFTDNEAAVKLYKNFGFVTEGTHRAFAFRNGSYTDAYMMARLHPRPPQVG